MSFMDESESPLEFLGRNNRGTFSTPQNLRSGTSSAPGSGSRSDPRRRRSPYHPSAGMRRPGGARASSAIALSVIVAIFGVFYARSYWFRSGEVPADVSPAVCSSCHTNTPAPSSTCSLSGYDAEFFDFRTLTPESRNLVKEEGSSSSSASVDLNSFRKLSAEYINLVRSKEQKSASVLDESKRVDSLRSSLFKLSDGFRQSNQERDALLIEVEQEEIALASLRKETRNISAVVSHLDKIYLALESQIVKLTDHLNIINHKIDLRNILNEIQKQEHGTTENENLLAEMDIMDDLELKRGLERIIEGTHSIQEMKAEVLSKAKEAFSELSSKTDLDQHYLELREKINEQTSRLMNRKSQVSRSKSEEEARLKDAHRAEALQEKKVKSLHQRMDRLSQQLEKNSHAEKCRFVTLFKDLQLVEDRISKYTRELNKINADLDRTAMDLFHLLGNGHGLSSSVASST